MAYDLNATTAYIREAARRRGIDPEIAVRVARSEGLARGTWQSNLSKGGRREPSYGPFQFLVGGDGTGYPTGMGNDFKRDTGLDPSDPRNVQATIDYAIDRASKDGWGAWYGAAKVGVGRRDGIGGARPVGPGAQPGAGSPLVDAVAAREIAGGSGSSRVMGGAGSDTLASGSSVSPTVEIGLSPEQKRKAAGYDAVTESGMKMGQNARNVWDAVGGLAQVWAGTSGARKLEDGEHSELVKAYAARGLTPDEQVIASAKGGREGLADVLAARQMTAQRTAERSEAQAWRQDEREYQRGRDTVEDQRWKAEQDRLAQGTLPAGYRRTETGMEPIPGGPADTARPDPNFKPSMTSVYTDDGGEQKGYFGQDGKWVPMGGVKAPSKGGGGVTISPDGTIQVGGAAPGGGAPGTPTNIPSGFMVDPNDPKRLAPIPGGPGEQIGGENAGRIGIAKSFLEDLPGIREDVAKGGVTGLLDAAAGQAGFGQAGRLYARIESGTDALQRMLSGAGMPVPEAQAYARRYMPSVKDTADIVSQKLGQLERELTNQMAIVTRGRGDVMGATPPRAGLVPGSDASGEMPPPNRAPAAPVDYRTRYGLE